MRRSKNVVSDAHGEPKVDETVPDCNAECQILDKLLSGRYSCRAFRPNPVPKSTILEILRLAQKTASWNNVQPWQVHITSGAETERFASTLQEAVHTEPHVSDFEWPSGYHGVYQDRRRACGFGLYAAVGIARGDREASARQTAENFKFFGAPHVAIITSDSAIGVYGAIDCGAYVSNFMLAAHSLNIATIAQGAIASRSQAVRKHFGMSDDRKVVCAISFGFADGSHPANAFRTTRADLNEVVAWLE